jgi:hypothetical protein
MSLSLDTVHYATNGKTVLPATPRTIRRRVDAAKIRRRLFNRRSGGTVISESSPSIRVRSHKPPLLGSSSRQAGLIVHSPEAGNNPLNFKAMYNHLSIDFITLRQMT